VKCCCDSPLNTQRCDADRCHGASL
jgi:hypothetical protein